MNITQIKTAGKYVASSVKNLPKNTQILKKGIDTYKTDVLEKNMDSIKQFYKPGSKKMQEAYKKIMEKAVKDFGGIKKQVGVGIAAIAGGVLLAGGVIKAIVNKFSNKENQQQ